MVEIHSATAQIRLGNKKEEKPQDENIMSDTHGGHNNDIKRSFGGIEVPNCSAKFDAPGTKGWEGQIFKF